MTLVGHVQTPELGKTGQAGFKGMWVYLKFTCKQSPETVNGGRQRTKEACISAKG